MVFQLDNYVNNSRYFDNILEMEIIIYKCNYKDFEYGIRYFAQLKKNSQKKIYLAEPFALLNSKAIISKYKFINAIINLEDRVQILEYFPKMVSQNIHLDGYNHVKRSIEKIETRKIANLEFSSGCLYKCDFCHIPLLAKKYHSKSIEQLINEIKYLITNLGKKYFVFNDSIFWRGNIDNQRILDFCEAVKKNNLRFYFMIYLTIEPKIPENILNSLREIGLIRIFFGIESISADFIRNHPKKIGEEKAIDFIKLVSQKKIS